MCVLYNNSLTALPSLQVGFMAGRCSTRSLGSYQASVKPSAAHTCWHPETDVSGQSPKDRLELCKAIADPRRHSIASRTQRKKNGRLCEQCVEFVWICVCVRCIFFTTDELLDQFRATGYFTSLNMRQELLHVAGHSGQDQQDLTRLSSQWVAQRIRKIGSLPHDCHDRRRIAIPSFSAFSNVYHVLPWFLSSEIAQAEHFDKDFRSGLWALGLEKQQRGSCLWQNRSKDEGAWKGHGCQNGQRDRRKADLPHILE